MEEIFTFSGSLGDLDLDVEDTAEIGLQFLSGMLASVHLDYLQQPPDHFLEIIATDGTLVWNYYEGEIKWYESVHNDWQIWKTPKDFVRNDMFLAQMHHFLALIGGETPPVCSLEDGIQDLRIALAALESSQSKKLVRLG